MWSHDLLFWNVWIVILVLYLFLVFSLLCFLMIPAVFCVQFLIGLPSVCSLCSSLSLMVPSSFPSNVLMSVWFVCLSPGLSVTSRFILKVTRLVSVSHSIIILLTRSNDSNKVVFKFSSFLTSLVLGS